MGFSGWTKIAFFDNTDLSGAYILAIKSIKFIKLKQKLANMISTRDTTQNAYYCTDFDKMPS